MSFYSELRKECIKLGLCDERNSTKFIYDQRYTIQAIQTGCDFTLRPAQLAESLSIYLGRNSNDLD